MRRRGSHSEKMLKPTVAAVRGRHRQQGQHRQQQEQHVRDVRRASEPSLPQGMSNGGISNAPHQRPQVATVHNNHLIAPQLQTKMPWQHQQQYATGQTGAQHHSYASAMDLISPTNPNATSGNATFRPFQSNLFNSSSHHTSHTAAAGDLLTMTRRALDPPPLNQNGAFAKKRSSTMTDCNSGNINYTCMNGSNAQGMGQLQVNLTHGHEQTHASQQPHSAEQFGGSFLNTQGLSITSLGADAYVSSSTGSGGDSEESCQHHRTVRRCCRSESFEMMEDS